MKPLLWTVVSLPFVGLAFFYFSSAKTVEPEEDAAAEKQAQKQPEARQGKGGVSTAPVLRQERNASAQATLDEARAALRATEKTEGETAARMAAMTPEGEKAVVNRLLKARTPYYKALFQSWDISPEAGDDALGIIHDRQLTVTVLRNELIREGAPFVNEYGRQLKSAEEKAARDLSGILGEGRAKELSSFEADNKNFLPKLK